MQTALPPTGAKVNISSPNSDGPGADANQRNQGELTKNSRPDDALPCKGAHSACEYSEFSTVSIKPSLDMHCLLRRIAQSTQKSSNSYSSHITVPIYAKIGRSRYFTQSPCPGAGIRETHYQRLKLGFVCERDFLWSPPPRCRIDDEELLATKPKCVRETRQSQSTLECKMGISLQ